MTTCEQRLSWLSTMLSTTVDNLSMESIEHASNTQRRGVPGPPTSFLSDSTCGQPIRRGRFLVSSGTHLTEGLTRLWITSIERDSILWKKQRNPHADQQFFNDQECEMRTSERPGF